MSSLSFRSSRVVYYGPHPCENCGTTICRAGGDFGGSSFTYPNTPIYPNTEWHAHFCNPQDVQDQRGKESKEEVLLDFPKAVPIKRGDYFLISSDGGLHIISCNQNYYDTVWAAWNGAKYRKENGYPTWMLEEK